MLARRDLWLNTVINAKNTTSLRAALESSLQAIINRNLQQTANNLNPEVAKQLVKYAAFAASMLDGMQIESKITNCFDLKNFPTAEINNLKIWQGLTELLLTKTGQLRKQVNKNTGFPAASHGESSEEKQYLKQQKQSFLALLNELRDDQQLLLALQDLQNSPPPTYTDQQWLVLQALLSLLPVLVAQLQLVFSQKQAVDFAQISQAASIALGAIDDPSDLALHLDHKIQHLLVDEFQDTSISQFQLLEQLTAGWQLADGRSLFLVGDPMQSIYRFREAQVGLFLRAQRYGIGDLPLEALTLTSNFRSATTIVNWVNQQFSFSFPDTANIELGAIPYNSSFALHESTTATVSLNPCENEILEAKKIIEIINRSDPNKSIAVLVRSRSHLIFLLSMLQQENIAFNAVELESLTTKYLIQDLWSLTKALLHPGDRLAWFSVLRAPWCAVSINDLLIIAKNSQEQTIWEALLNHQELNLSQHAQQVLPRIITAIEAALSWQQRLSLHELINKLWLNLGGPATLHNEHDINDATRFFELLETCEQSGDLLDYAVFTGRLQRLYADNNHAENCNLQILTIHKSKGLEFDTVILPGLHQRSATSSPPLLRWAELPDVDGTPRLLLAPIKATANQNDALYKYLTRVETLKEQYEMTRLFYVAATRAKNNLHLTFCLPFDPETNNWQAPTANSLLDKIWQNIDATVNAIKPADVVFNNIDTDKQHYRLCGAWQAPEKFQIPVISGHNDPHETNVIFNNDYHASLGTLIHRMLRQVCLQNITSWDYQLSEKYSANWRTSLRSLGVAAPDLDLCLQTMHQALTTTLNDPTGRWLLDASHQDSQCEYALTRFIKDELKTIIIDRTFVADQQRWIIDYKTTAATTENINEHQGQLEKYAKWFAAVQSLPIKTALYFPLEAKFHVYE